VTYDERCVVCDIYVHAHAHAHAAHMRCDMCMHMHTCNMHCACACACTCACACACACVACACIWGSGRSDQSFIPFQSPTRTFAMSLLFPLPGVGTESTRVDSNSRPCRCLRYDKIRLLGFTTLHDLRRYATPRCLDPSHPDTKARLPTYMYHILNELTA
jgi:hypothetical protein